MVLRGNPAVLAFVIATSLEMLFAATALTPVPRRLQDYISALVVQVGVTGAAEQQSERKLLVSTDTARRVGAQSTSTPGRQFARLDTIVGGCRLESSD